MPTDHRSRRAFGLPIAPCPLICSILLSFAATAAAAPAGHAHSTASARSSNAIAVAARARSLTAAARLVRRTDRAVAADARELKRCLRANRAYPEPCDHARHALRLAHGRLAKAKLRLARIARAVGRPTISTPEHARSAPKSPDLFAPALTVSGQTLTWTRVANISTYVLATRVPGQAEQDTEVSGTSVTPPAVAGATVGYSVRTDVEGSAWSSEVSITYPATAPSTPPAPVEPTSSSPSPTSMWVGLNAGGWGPKQYADVAGAAQYVRLNSSVEKGCSTEGWAQVGIQVICDISGPYSTGGVEALNISEWVSNAVAIVKANPAILAVEVLNEPYNPAFWGPEPEAPGDKKAYAALVKAVHEAFVTDFGSAHPLILAAGGKWNRQVEWTEDTWDEATNGGVDMAAYADGVTIHPYPEDAAAESGDMTAWNEGNRWIVTRTHELTGKPVYVTEVGWECVNVPAEEEESPHEQPVQISEAQQAEDYKNFADWAHATGYVAAVTFYGYRGGGWGVESWLKSGEIGRHKPSYFALKELSEQGV